MQRQTTSKDICKYKTISFYQNSSKYIRYNKAVHTSSQASLYIYGSNAKEVVFVPPSVRLSVSGITRKVLGDFHVTL